MRKLTAESPYVVALFDGSDAEGMQIYRELGFEAEVSAGSWTVMDILQRPLEAGFRRHNYVPLDEWTDYVAGTVLLYVFTKGVVVARRFEKGDGPLTTLREVKRSRDIELHTNLKVQGIPAFEIMVQKCAPMLRKLWDGDNDRVAWIAWASHGAKVGYVTRAAALTSFRDTAKLRRETAPDSATLQDRIAEQLAAGPHPGQINCVITGWSEPLHLRLDVRSLTVHPPREFGARQEDLIRERIEACRDQRRALGLLEKCLDKLGPASPATGPLLDLTALVRHQWQDCSAVLAAIPVVQEAAMTLGLNANADRLRVALLALTQATIERKRGGAMKAPVTAEPEPPPKARGADIDWLIGRVLDTGTRRRAQVSGPRS